MNLNIIKQINDKLNKDDIKITIETSHSNNYSKRVEEYLNHFVDSLNDILIKRNGRIEKVDKDNIIYFYTKDRKKICKTINEEFEVYTNFNEIEKKNVSFIRISKSCIINIDNIKFFDVSYTGKIIVKFIDNTEKKVARRKVRDIIEYIDERKI